jgi:hypothetical protein
MYLNAQVTMGIDKLDEQGKFVTEALVVGFAQQKAFLLADQLVECLPVVDKGCLVVLDA